MKDKAKTSRGRQKNELTQAYKSYAETCHPRFENAADSVLCTPTNDEFKLPNWKCVLQKCTTCTYIALP